MAHSGVSAAGAFVRTLVLTAIATGWTECVPVLMQAGALALEALQAAQGLFPFPLRGVDFDNDGAFMNEPVVSWCRAQGLKVTRSRAYRKNDQAWVEQKNGAIVRRLVGYGRLEGMAAAEALARLYAAAYEPVPALVQAVREDPGRRAGDEALAPAGHAGRSGPGLGTARHGEHGAHRRAEGPRRSGDRARGDPRGAGRAGPARRSARCRGGPGGEGAGSSSTSPPASRVPRRTANAARSTAVPAGGRSRSRNAP